MPSSCIGILGEVRYNLCGAGVNGGATFNVLAGKQYTFVECYKYYPLPNHTSTQPMPKIILFLCFFSITHIHAQTTVDDMDLEILLKLEHSRTHTQTGILRTISDANNYVNAAIPISLFVAGMADHNKDLRQNALYIASSAASTALLNFAVKQIFKRHRPFEVHATLTPVYKPGGYSFPSGHTSLSFATATALSRAYPKWYVIVPSFLWAGTVGYSRLYMGVHNPSDVFTGAALGIGMSSALSFIKP